MKDYGLIFRAVVGSQAYGLATENSDVDIKGVYQQPNDDFLVLNQYKPHYTVNKDEFYFELRNFINLLAAGNPTAIELLCSPKECILETSPVFEEIVKVKSMFFTKKLYDSFGGYALNQLKKARGLDKKFNWEASRVERRTIVDFCKIVDRKTGKSHKLSEWLIMEGIRQDEIGLTALDGFRDAYKLFFGYELYRGVMIAPTNTKEETEWLDGNERYSNQPRTSVVPKELQDTWKGVVYFNREEYSKHCRDYKSYKHWLDHRNEQRYKESREGQQYDSKNIMHTVRLVMMIENIHKKGYVDIDMSDHRKYLLDIKMGKVNLEKIFNEFMERAQNIANLKKESTLPEDVSEDATRALELTLRKMKWEKQ